MKNFSLFIIAGLLAVSCNQPVETQKTKDASQIQEVQSEQVKDGVFIHITEGYNDPHRVLMPMQMAVLMAEDKDVLVYMDIHAVELLVKDAEDLSFDGFDSFRTYLQQLLGKNVGVYACPTCLKVAGFNPEDLIEGIQTANKEVFFNFTKGRIITLDY
ncbi:MAG: peroxiredoxin [Bacteroidetes bacterium]|nr:peroxiredoxin [Bacteroidota bacterium]